MVFGILGECSTSFAPLANDNLSLAGITEDHKLSNVPGTAVLSTKFDQPTTTAEGGGLKRGSGKSAHIVLIPQPSDDPCDPLNWPWWKKEACFWTLVFMTSIASALPPLANSAFVPLAKEFRVSVDQVASSFGATVPGVGVFTLIQNTLAVKYGHRPVYLLSTFLMFVSCIWTAVSRDLVSIRASRVFQGFGEAAPQVLIPATLEHLYLGPLLNSYVIQNFSWQLGFWFVSIACGLSMICVFLFVPETTYLRQAPSSSYKSTVHDHSAGEGDAEKTPRTSAMSEVETHDFDHDALPTSSTPPTFPSQLRIYNGTFSEESLWRIFLRPFPFLLSPVTWFMFFTFSLPTVWLNLVSLCASTIFTVTYGFNAAQTGLTNLGGVVGVVFAMIVIGPLVDSWIVWLSQRNRGVYEPEYRLAFMLSMLFGVFGFVGWAIGNAHHMPWIGAVACIAMLCFSLVVSGASALAYLLDTHGANGAHIFALTDVARAATHYSSTFFANGRVRAAGVERALLVLGACQAACALAAVPMYVCGKRVRSFIVRHPRLFRGDVPTPAFPQLAPVVCESPGAGRLAS